MAEHIHHSGSHSHCTENSQLKTFSNFPIVWVQMGQISLSSFSLTVTEMPRHIYSNTQKLFISCNPFKKGGFENVQITWDTENN